VVKLVQHNQNIFTFLTFRPLSEAVIRRSCYWFFRFWTRREHAVSKQELSYRKEIARQLRTQYTYGTQWPWNL